MSDRWLLDFGVLAMVFAAGCGKVPERHYVLSERTMALEDAGNRKAIAEALAQHFGTPEAPRLEGTDLVSQERLDAGSKLYRIHCLHCHGVTGDGQGPTAPFLYPRPRDYRQGVFKFTSTDYGVAPTEDDLRRTLDEGVPGTSMPSFKLLPEEEREALLDYVVLLSMRGQVERLLVEEAEFGPLEENLVDDQIEFVISQWENAPNNVMQPREAMPPYSDELALKGRDLFLSTTGAGCVGCHGRDFRGRGQQEMNPDSWGNTIRPADLTLGIYRGGRRPIDLYWRIATGISGTPMPGSRTTRSDEEIWQMVHFVRALPYREDFQQTPPMTGADQVASKH